MPRQMSSADTCFHTKRAINALKSITQLVMDEELKLSGSFQTASFVDTCDRSQGMTRFHIQTGEPKTPVCAAGGTSSTCNDQDGEKTIKVSHNSSRLTIIH